MSTLYVNANTGADTPSSQGTQEAPYQSAAYALYVNADAKLQVYKEATEETPAGYFEISASALKKAKKGAEGLKKKDEKAKK